MNGILRSGSLAQDIVTGGDATPGSYPDDPLVLVPGLTEAMPADGFNGRPLVWRSPGCHPPYWVEALQLDTSPDSKPSRKMGSERPKSTVKASAGENALSLPATSRLETRQ